MKRLRCSGIFNHILVANLMLSPLVKELRKSTTFGEDIDHSRVSCAFFLLAEYNRFTNQRSNIEKQHQTMTANNI